MPLQFSRSVFATPWTAARQAFLSITNPGSLIKLMSIESVIPSNHLILLFSCLLSILVPFSWLRHQGLFGLVSSSHQVAKVLESELQHQSFPLVQLCVYSFVFSAS